MKGIVNYLSISHFLSDLGLPPSKYSDIHVVKLEDYYSYDESRAFGPYRHKLFELSLTWGYEGAVAVDENYTNTKTCKMVFVSPGQTVSWQMDHSTSNASSFVILFSPEFLSATQGLLGFYKSFPFFNKYTSPTFSLSENQQLFYKDIFEELYMEYKLGAGDSLELLRPMLSLLLLRAKREFQASQNVNFQKTRAEEITYLFENLIQLENFKRHSIEYFAEKLNISGVYLAECVKRVTKKTAKQIVDEYLILDAKTRISQSQQSISEISYEIGFSEVTNFVKFFKRQTGVTPKNYRLDHSI